MHAQTLVTSGLRKSTLVTYAAHQSQFQGFCNKHSLCALPASEQTITRYLAYLTLKPGRNGTGMAPSTLHSHLAAIRNNHIVQGYELPNTSSPRISLMIKSVAQNAPPPNVKKPITFALYSNMVDTTSRTYEGALIRAILGLAWFGTLRGNEYLESRTLSGVVLSSAPLLSYVSFGTKDKLPYMIYKVPQSKTLVNGFTKYLGCSKVFHCSPCSMYSYLEARRGLHMNSANSPLFLWADKTLVTKDQFNKVIKTIMVKLGGHAGDYSTHSLRSGSVSEASLYMPTWFLKEMGLWKSSSYQGYIRNSAAQHIASAVVLAGGKGGF